MGDYVTQVDGDAIQILGNGNVTYSNNLTLNVNGGMILSSEEETLIRMIRRKRRKKQFCIK